MTKLQNNTIITKIKKKYLIINKTKVNYIKNLNVCKF